MSGGLGDHVGTATTWHHCLIARWWANFNLDGPEIEFFRSYVAAGQPALDYEVGEFDDERWRRLQPRSADETPPPSEDRQLAPDGFHYALRHRLVAVDVAERSMTRELQAWQWEHDELVAHETHTLVANIYTSDEIVTLLASVGFTDLRVLGGYHGGAPTERDQFHVFVAAAPG